MTATAPRSRTPRPVPAARLCDAPLPPVDSSIPPWPGEQVGVGDLDLYVRRTPGPPGGGEPALYVHGLGGAATNWTDYAGLLATRLDGEALDLPGFGHAGPSPTGRYGVTEQARAVLAYLEHRGRRPVHLVGNSLGGVVALLVAAERPELVRTLTLIARAMPWLRPRRGSDLAVPMLLVPGIGTYAQRRLDSLPPERRAAGLLQLVFAEPGAVPRNRVQETIAEMGRRQQLPYAGDAFTGSLRGWRAPTWWPGRARCGGGPRRSPPTLVVWGAADRLVPVALAARTAAAVPDSRLLVLPNVGHVPQLEAAEPTARATLALIEDAERAR